MAESNIQVGQRVRLRVGGYPRTGVVQAVRGSLVDVRVEGRAQIATTTIAWVTPL